MSSSGIALKEWAVVCEAIARHEQMILFRKGGIHEAPGGFRPEHAAFWLFPTGFHQFRDHVLPEFQEQAVVTLGHPPPAGQLALQHYCRTQQVAWISEESQLTRLLPFQILHRDALLTRFHYRRPGLFVIRVEVESLAIPTLIPALSAYDGCHSWVELQSPVSTDALLPTPRAAGLEHKLGKLLEIFPELQ